MHILQWGKKEDSPSFPEFLSIINTPPFFTSFIQNIVSISADYKWLNVPIVILILNEDITDIEHLPITSSIIYNLTTATAHNRPEITKNLVTLPTHGIASTEAGQLVRIDVLSTSRHLDAPPGDLCPRRLLWSRAVA